MILARMIFEHDPNSQDTIPNVILHTDSYSGRIVCHYEDPNTGSKYWGKYAETFDGSSAIASFR